MVQKLYSTLNVFYLKLFQYEKYLDKKAIDSLRNTVNQELTSLKDKYDQSHRLSEMTLEDFYNYCLINPIFDRKMDINTLERALEDDMASIPVFGYPFLMTYNGTLKDATTI